MDESEKLRMNLVAIQKVDPYAKEILDSCSHVAFYKYINNEWEKSEIEGSFFVYSRVAEPFHSIFINNRLNTNSLVEPITKPIELQSQPPFLLYRNQRSAISGFWFYCKEDCVRIHGLLEKLIKKCNTNITKSDQVVTHHPLPQQQQHHHQQTSFQNIQGLNGNSNSQKKDVDIFSMLTKAQAEFTSSNGPPNLNLVAVEQKFSEMQMNPIQVIQQQQQQQPSAPSHHHHQPLMKQISSAMPDITSPNVVSFFAAAQQPNANGVVLDGHHQIIQPQGQPHFLANPHQIVQQPPVQTLDEIEKQHRVSSISPKVEQKLLNNLVQQGNNQHQQQINSSQPIMLLKQSGPGGMVSQQQQQQLQHPPQPKPTLITPTMFQASTIEDKAILGMQTTMPTTSTPIMRPEPLTQNQLIQALNYLLENDPEFIRKIHEAYIKSLSK